LRFDLRYILNGFKAVWICCSQLDLNLLGQATAKVQIYPTFKVSRRMQFTAIKSIRLAKICRASDLLAILLAEDCLILCFIQWLIP